MSAMSRVGVLGLGIMGLAMADNLIKSGFEVWGFDIDPDRLKRFKSLKGRPGRSVQDVANHADVIITSLPSAHALRSVCESLGQAQARQRTVIETSTLPIGDKLHSQRTLRAMQITLLDCPLSGTGSQAQTRDLVVYASGAARAYQSIVPVLQAFSRNQFYLGRFGNGMKLKLIANYLVAIHNAAAAEALVLAEKSKLDLSLVLDAIGDSAGQSRMWQVRGPRMVAEDYSPMMTLHLWQKDMGIISEFVTEAGVSSPVFDTARSLYDRAYALGHADSDSSVIHRLLKSASRAQGVGATRIDKGTTP